MAETNEKKVDGGAGYVGATMGVKHVRLKDVDKRIDERLASGKFRESLMKILESVKVTVLSQEIHKTHKEINGLKRRLAKLEKKGKASGTRRH